MKEDCEPLRGKTSKELGTLCELFYKEDVASAVKGFKEELLSNCSDHYVSLHSELIKKWFADVIEK